MQGQYSLRSPAVKRLMKEAQELSKPTEQYSAQPLEDNLFEWHFTIRGPVGTDFDGGIYHGRIVLPPDYPMKPPSIILLTPNGRFETNKKICLSISGYHPESWQPSWSIRTALLAIIGFMPTHGNGAIGSLDYTKEERHTLSIWSHSWKCPNCGDVNKLLPAVTGADDAGDEEAKKLASQIKFKAEKEKDVQVTIQEQEAVAPRSPPATSQPDSQPDSQPPVIAPSHSNTPTTSTITVNAPAEISSPQTNSQSNHTNPDASSFSPNCNYGEMPINFGYLPGNYGSPVFPSNSSDSAQTVQTNFSPCFPPPFISPAVVAMFNQFPFYGTPPFLPPPYGSLNPSNPVNPTVNLETARNTESFASRDSESSRSTTDAIGLQGSRSGESISGVIGSQGSGSGESVTDAIGSQGSRSGESVTDAIGSQGSRSAESVTDAIGSQESGSGHPVTEMRNILDPTSTGERTGDNSGDRPIEQISNQDQRAPEQVEPQMRQRTVYRDTSPTIRLSNQNAEINQARHNRPIAWFSLLLMFALSLAIALLLLRRIGMIYSK